MTELKDTTTDFEVEIQPACLLCGRTERAHTELGMMHRFSPPGQSSRLFEIDSIAESPPDSVPVKEGSVRIASQSSRSDPLLRMLLIRKGLVTLEELDALEAELKTVGWVTNDVDQS